MQTIFCPCLRTDEARTGARVLRRVFRAAVRAAVANAAALPADGPSAWQKEQRDLVDARTEWRALPKRGSCTSPRWRAGISERSAIRISLWN